MVSKMHTLPEFTNGGAAMFDMFQARPRGAERQQWALLGRRALPGGWQGAAGRPRTCCLAHPRATLHRRLHMLSTFW